MNELDKAYVSWKHWEDGGFGKFTPEEARYFAAETSLNTVPAPRVLEIGFGNGSFLGWIKSLGCEVFGIESNPLLVARAGGLLGPDRAFDALEDMRLSRLAGRISHVIAFDVIEHIPVEALSGVLQRIRNLLAPNGRLIVRFPNGDSPFGRISQHGDPTHVTTIGRQKLEYLARSAGLKILEIRAPALPILGSGPGAAARRLLIKVGRALFERVIGLMYLQGRCIPLDPNYVAILVSDAVLQPPNLSAPVSKQS
jgi:SAM-dependent methyltransferase